MHTIIMHICCNRFCINWPTVNNELACTLMCVLIVFFFYRGVYIGDDTADFTTSGVSQGHKVDNIRLYQLHCILHHMPCMV